MCHCIMCHGRPPKSRYRAAPFCNKCSHIDQRATNRVVPAPTSEGNRYCHSRFRLRDGPILLQRSVIPAPHSAGRLSPPVGGRGQLARDSGMHGSYLLNTNSQTSFSVLPLIVLSPPHHTCTKNDTSRRRQSAIFSRTAYGT